MKRHIHALAFLSLAIPASAAAIHPVAPPERPATPSAAPEGSQGQTDTPQAPAPGSGEASDSDDTARRPSEPEPGLADVEPAAADIEPEEERTPSPKTQQPQAPPRPDPIKPYSTFGDDPAPCPESVDPGARNLPPTWNYGDERQSIRTGEVFTLRPHARDPEAKRVTYKVISVPARAKTDWIVDRYHPCNDLDRRAQSSTAPRITWTPRRSDVGPQVIVLEASDGEAVSRLTYTLDVEHHDSAIFLPGASYTVFAPKGHDSLYHGPAFELLLGGWIDESQDRGPGVGRIYTSIGMLHGDALPDAVQFNFGFDLSFEGRPRRSFLIPYFGLETGGLFRQTGKNVGHFTPRLGAHLIATRNVFLSVSGGHLFPTARIDELPGYTGRASLNIAFW